MSMNEMDKAMVAAAYRELNIRRNILAPEAEATVEYCDFDPFRPVQVVAVVSWPAVVNCKPVTLHHAIMDGDRIPATRRGF